MQISSISAKILLTKRWNTAVALVRLKGITNHLKEPQRVWKEVFHSSPSAMQTRWYVCRRSTLV